MIYGLVGESLWETGVLSVRGVSVPYYSLLTPALVGLPLTLEDVRSGIEVAQALQAVAMSLVAVPVYLWARRLAGVRWAIVAAALSVLPPALWYGGLLMTEALYYPLVTAALLGLANVLEQPTLTRQGVFVMLLTLAAAVRLQALILLPAMLLAVGLDAWFGRSLMTLRRLAPMLGLTGLATVVTFAAYGGDRDELLGAYGTLAAETPSSTGAIAQLLWHGATLAVMTLVLPLLATATLVVGAARKGEGDRALRAFLAATAAYAVLLVGQVSVFAAGNLDHVSERYLLTAVPPLLVGLCVWLARGAPRPAIVVAPLAVISVVALAALPLDRAGTKAAAHDTLTILPFVQSATPGDVAFRAALAGFGAIVACAFILLPRRLLPATAAGLAVGFVALSVLAAREIDRFSREEQTNAFATADPRWVDDTGAPSVLLLDIGDRPWPTVARVTFWNRSVRRLVRLSGVLTPGPLPEPSVDIADDGSILDAAGRVVSHEQALIPATITVAGRRLASSPPTATGPGYGLWSVDEPLHIVSRTDGLTPVGDFTDLVRVVVYRCTEGNLELTLLGKQGFPVEIRVNGFLFESIQPAAGEVWHGSVPALPAPDGNAQCVFELDTDGLVGSTRVEWVPAAKPS